MKTQLDEIYDELKGTIDDAEKSTIPYPVSTPDEKLKIVGDANNTPKVKSTFHISFLIPKDKVPNVDAPTIGKDKLIKKVFEDVEISAEKVTAINFCITNLMPYFYKPEEDGKVTNYDEKLNSKIRKAFMDKEFIQILRDLTQIVLDIDDSLINYVSYMSLLEVLNTLGKEHPEIINESFSFFV